MTWLVALQLQAETTYPYLTFELTDGSKASVSVASDVTLTFSGTTLTVGEASYTLTNLSKMYFTTTDETTTGISELMTDELNEATEIYDLQGKKVSRQQMRRGVYIIKTKSGVTKLNVR